MQKTLRAGELATLASAKPSFFAPRTDVKGHPTNLIGGFRPFADFVTLKFGDLTGGFRFSLRISAKVDFQVDLKVRGISNTFPSRI